MSLVTSDVDDCTELHAIITEVIRSAEQRPEAQAAQLASTIMSALRMKIPGNLYIAAGLTLRERYARDNAVRAEYTGRNRPEICAKYRISQAQLYRIIARRK